LIAQSLMGSPDQPVSLMSTEPPGWIPMNPVDDGETLKFGATGAGMQGSVSAFAATFDQMRCVK
jgi:hypothetical protein